MPEGAPAGAGTGVRGVAVALIRAAASPPRTGVDLMTFITPNFLLPYSSQASDYRCAVNATGGAVVFERTVFKTAGGSGKPQLYLLDLTQSGAAPTLFLQDQSIEISDRPDWSWLTGDVAFNFGPDIWVGVAELGRRRFQIARGANGAHELSDMVPRR